MEERVVYLSEAWRQAAERKIREQVTPEKMNHTTTSMSNVYRNCPDGKDRFLYLSFVDGVLEELRVGEGEPPEADFRVTGDYETFARITRAELGAQRALMTGKLKLKGNMVRALKLASLADRVNKVFSTIPATY